jgi:hypothetical protein
MMQQFDGVYVDASGRMTHMSTRNFLMKSPHDSLHNCKQTPVNKSLTIKSPVFDSPDMLNNEGKQKIKIKKKEKVVEVPESEKPDSNKPVKKKLKGIKTVL